MRHEFPTAWHRFLNPVGNAGDNSAALELQSDLFPVLFQRRSITLGTLAVLIKVEPSFAATHSDATINLTLAAGTNAPTSTNHQANDLLTLAPWNGLWMAEKTFQQTPGSWTMNAWLDDGGGPSRLDPKAIEDVFVVCRYTVG